MQGLCLSAGHALPYVLAMAFMLSTTSTNAQATPASTTATAAGFSTTNASAQSTLTIGLVNNYEYAQARKEMEATFRLLDVEPEFVVGTAREIRELARISKIDLAYSSSSFFACLAAEYDATPVASVVLRQNGIDVSRSGGVMFAASNNSAVKTMDDFAGKILAAIGRDSLLGFQAQRQELLRNDYNVYDLFPQVIYTGDAEQVVWEVLNGVADVGFVKSGVIESMIKRGLVYDPDIHFINEYNHRLRNGDAYPFRCSTDLYGEWVLSSIGELSELVIHTAVAQLLEFDNTDFVRVGLPSISYFRPPLAYINTLDLLEDLTIMIDDGVSKSCDSLSSDIEDVVCAFGWAQAADVSCQSSTKYTCPDRGDINYSCVCEPCVKVCSSDEVYTPNGNCRCKAGFVRLGSTCQPMGVFIAELLVPLVFLVVLLVAYLMHRQRLKADGIWQIEAHELVLEQPTEVLGSGSFGVVLAAKLRGQRVAVKRAYVNKRQKYRTDSKAPDSMIKGSANNALGLPFRSHRHTSKGKHRTTRHHVRNVFVEAEAIAEKVASSSHGSTFQSGRVTTMSTRPWYQRMFGPSAETLARRQLFREMRLLSRMQHDNICRMMGAVIESGMEPLMVLEYMEMGSLYSMLHNEAMDLDDEFRYNAVHDITSGMRYLHNADLIHGDLKALNCLVDSKFHVKVSDFGMAGFASEHSQRGGTLAWMAPELLQGDVTSFASDVYSFGVVMFEIFAREDPYEDTDFDSETLAQNVVRRKLRPSAPSNMPPEFSVLMNESLAADPDTRPTFVELLRRIEPLEGKMKINARKGNAMLQDNALLEQVFPKHIATALREGRTIEPEHHAEVTIFFSDICGFTDMSATLEPVQVSNMLDRLYTVFDKLCDKHGLYKIETIGDAYMCVGNLFTPQPDHAARVARFAMDALAGANAIPILEDEPDGDHIDIRVGFHSGPVVSNVVGTLTPRFCLFGSTVNCASRMESNSVRNCIHMSPEAAALVQKQDVSLNVIRRDPVVTIKGLGKMQTYWLGHAPSTQEAEAAKPARKSLLSVASRRSSRRASMLQDTNAAASVRARIPETPHVIFDEVAVDMDAGWQDEDEALARSNTASETNTDDGETQLSSLSESATTVSIMPDEPKLNLTQLAPVSADQNVKVMGDSAV
ncbi:uncharacterized protein MONBRDRAFT_26544 [Monosiga brevicollis MX1]|uniref:guanylate cyclase n=1 Tax=Monosiga brevicollis TaxID=81824 RepID=A9V2P0_MONBE|nr:uncharacterized protein MONBRDRAFT_26544 [Monosiga brevicollis MX1]EDQ88293.1 predicted protein [Monosiga brevicollis MX1]|eukprot:XP_001746886.1 hypothetical protein [Monosiga brevicollis MX1]